MAENIIWSDRKRIIFGLPWSFTKYTLTDEKLLIRSGLFSTKEEEVRLYRILDVTVRRTLLDKIFGIGTIHCCSADKSTPEFDILNIKHCLDVKNQLSDLVEDQRIKKRIAGREFMTDMDDDYMD